MIKRHRVVLGIIMSFLVAPYSAAFGQSKPKIDTTIESLMEQHSIPGLAIATIKDGNVAYKKTFGFREVESSSPLNNDTVMYGASLTKFVFAAYVMQLADEGLIDIDASIADQLPQPLPAYEKYSDLEGDERWRALTLRLLLAHQSGFPNFRFFPPNSEFDPDAKLAFVFDPGVRYGYSGEGYYIAQLVVEEALGLDTGDELQRRFFDPLGMTRTSLTWRDDFRPNFAQGYTVNGVNEGHNMQSNVRAAGSMDTTLNDFSLWVAAFMSGDLIGTRARDALFEPGLPITSRRQFPPWDPTDNPDNAKSQLAAGIGVETFVGLKGHGFLKGGHNDKTDNMLLCLTEQEECILLLMNTAKGHLIFPQIIEAVVGPTGMPWPWKYSSLPD